LADSRYIAGHLTIGDNVRIQAQSGGRNIKDNEVLQGSPAFGYMLQ
jgi:UDP-3-O-[3-hydroxymyristoyl] glucosamine N-acyltransferase